ncbi:MAG: outer membrane lipoprotein-sorting protein [Candidatus Binatia bacterium]
MKAGWRAAAAALLLAAAAPAAEDGNAVLERARALNRGERYWNDRTQRMRLTIVDRRGNEHRRELEVRTKRYGPEASRSIMFFHAPPHVEGIGFLQWVDPRGADHQWLWLPALKRVRQISQGARTESFVGTDFSYEDLAIMAEALDWGSEEASAAPVGEDVIDGQRCAVIELRPTPAADVHYGTVRLWLGTEDYVVHKYEFRDASGEPVKTLALSDVRVESGIPSAHHLEMRNERTGGRTVAELSELAFNRGLSDEEFTQRRLEKGL